MKLRVSYVLNVVLVLACVATWAWFARAQRAMEAERLARSNVPLLAARWKTTGPVELYLKDTSGTERQFQSSSVGKNLTLTTEVLQDLEEHVKIMQQLLMAGESQVKPSAKQIGTLRGTSESTGKIELLPVYREGTRQILVQHAGKTYSATLSEKSSLCLEAAMK